MRNMKMRQISMSLVRALLLVWWIVDGLEQCKSIWGGSGFVCLLLAPFCPVRILLSSGTWS